MYIEDTQAAFHEVDISIKGGVTTALVSPVISDPAEPGESYTIPEAEITGDTEAAVGGWLTSAAGPLEGGTVMTTDEYNLLVAQRAKHAEIKARRIELEEGGLPTSFGVVDSEPDSQRKISGGVQMALISLNSTNTVDVPDGAGGTTTVSFSQAFFPDGFPVVWRFQDNSERPMLAEEMVQMGVEVGKQVAQCQMVKNYFDGLVRNATTVEEVEAIDIDINWLALDLSAV